MKKTLFKLLVLLFLIVSCKSIIAQDTIPPVILITQDTQVQINETWTFQNPVATDNVTPANSISIFWSWRSNGVLDSRKRGTYELEIIATDNSRNTTNRVVTYTVDDFILPVIDLRTPDTVCHRINTTYTSVAATATDNYYAASQVSLVLSKSTVDPYNAGLYQEIFIATDGSGNKDTAIRYVRVGDCNATNNPKLSQETMHFYPNPANEKILIKGIMSDATLEIINLDGKVLKSTIITTNSPILNVSNLKNGVYLLHIQNSKINQTSKISILH